MTQKRQLVMTINLGVLEHFRVIGELGSELGSTP